VTDVKSPLVRAILVLDHDLLVLEHAARVENIQVARETENVRAELRKLLLRVGAMEGLRRG
jgi:hypothetical protein